MASPRHGVSSWGEVAGEVLSSHLPAGRIPRSRRVAGHLVALGSAALKRPKRAMVGAWSGLDNRPCWSGIQHATQQASAPQMPAVAARPAGHRARHHCRVRQTKGCAVAAHPSGKAATNHPSYLRTGEVADILYVSPKTVSRWAKDGRLPFLKTLGGQRRYPEAEIRDLAEELRQEAIT
jgi:excisionase family DNA binding protein